MLHRLCGSPSIPLSFNLAAVLPRRRTYRVSCDTERLTLPTSSPHRLWRGLPGYLILFAPHAFVPERRYWTRKPLSPLMFLPISTHFTAPPEVPYAPISLKTYSFEGTSLVELEAFTLDLYTRLRTL